MLKVAPSALLDHYLGISRLLAGQLDFRSAIKAVGAEVAHIIPHDHLDVCMTMDNGHYHTAYESGLDTAWGELAPAPVGNSPIRALLWGEVEVMLTEDAQVDPQFHFENAFTRPIFEQNLRSRIHVPLKVSGEIIGALSCSSHRVGFYTNEDVANALSIADLLSPYFFALRSADQAKQSAIVEAEARAREEGLRLGALNLTEALEWERQRIGMDLHDQTLADLTRLSRRLDRLMQEKDLHAEMLEPVSRSLQHCMQDLREIIEEAKPSVLQLFGFAHAVENHLERAVRDQGATALRAFADETEGLIDQLDQTERIALFRIAQEAINNAVRHAQADLVEVKLRRSAQAVVIEVTDDGQGLPADVRHRGGIDNMMTRARLISAKFMLGAGRGGHGTTVRVQLPLKTLQKRVGGIEA
ncbi:GAF domain-containing sensor histidine kinase [Peteryoungia ipomoeae]|uniref:GAF domain-containing sensor histidine kinase n=1 Tax=Peteryoungia ipomoeae TaxID=1210932 RepID=A0A4S8NT31_9HYPH|nr:GAF domain-containing sensor histidine kinase [Peteryoungia ipomoeae]THV20593.1 GAF domain-containing sensor histidine kinase [Peteryoungia ipomoeae]